MCIGCLQIITPCRNLLEGGGEHVEAPEGDWLAEVVEQLIQQAAADAAELS